VGHSRGPGNRARRLGGAPFVSADTHGRHARGDGGRARDLHLPRDARRGPGLQLLGHRPPRLRRAVPGSAGPGVVGAGPRGTARLQADDRAPSGELHAVLGHRGRHHPLSPEHRPLLRAARVARDLGAEPRADRHDDLGAAQPARDGADARADRQDRAAGRRGHDVRDHGLAHEPGALGQPAVHAVPERGLRRDPARLLESRPPDGQRRRDRPRAAARAAAAVASGALRAQLRRRVAGGAGGLPAKAWRRPANRAPARVNALRLARLTIRSRRRSSESGIALPMALIVLGLLTTLTLAFLAITVSEPSIAMNQMMNAQARAIAESGLERAIWALSKGETAPGTTGALADPLPSPVPAAYASGSIGTNGHPDLTAPPGGVAIAANQPASSFAPFLFTDSDMAILKSLAKANGTYYQGDQHWTSPQPNGVIFVDTPSGNPFTNNSPDSDIIGVDIHGNWRSGWSGWLVVAGSIQISGNMNLTGLIYAQNDVTLHGAGAGRISGAVISTTRLDSASTP